MTSACSSQPNGRVRWQGWFAMGWVGQSSVSSQIGSPVRIGEFVMPRKAAYTVEGANGDPDLRVLFQIREGRPEVVEVQAAAKPDGRGLRTSDLQVLGLDALTVSVFARLSQQVIEVPGSNVTRMVPVTDERELWRAVKDADAAVKAPWRGEIRAELELVASTYRQHVNARPVQAVQAVMGYKSTRTTARRIKAAEAAGLLPPTTPGRRRKGDPAGPVQTPERPRGKHPETS